MTLFSRVRHWFCLNTGTVVTEWRDEELWIGFACECGETHHWHKSERILRRLPDQPETSEEPRKSGGFLTTDMALTANQVADLRRRWNERTGRP